MVIGNIKKNREIPDETLDIREEKVVLVNAGGDGSLMRIIQDLKESNIDISECSYVMLPFGTANDLPRSFGWGKDAPKRMLTDIYWLME